MSRSVRDHVVWGLLGAAAAISMWFAWSAPGAIGMFACIGAAFALWRFMSRRGAWLALAVLGVSMSSVLGWQAVTGARCPPGDTKVTLQAGKPPVSCDEIRASAASMSAFFGIVALLAIAAPFYFRSLPDDADHHDAQDGHSSALT